jgi:xylan 1,4-beta-xylosidase
MLEDIVYMDEYDNLCYDFRVSDARLDYLVSLGFDLLIAYAGIPECIARREHGGCSVAKGKTRYKGKMFNTNIPTDFALWEEICYQYTKHNIERYGLDVVSKWHLHCWNEPDCESFFMKGVDADKEQVLRATEYCKLYDAFIRGAERASKELTLGGTALAGRLTFFEVFLKHVKDTNARLDFISMHIYGTGRELINSGERPICTKDIFKIYDERMEIIRSYGFEHLPVLIDEWGMSTAGFYNIEECPDFIKRENEVFSAYFVKMISEFVHRADKLEMLMICLSGQHEMVTDFTGFRNFFTLNFMAKPIYNAHLLSSFLKKNLVALEGERENLFVLPTKDEGDNYSVLLTYSSDFFDENIESYEEEVVFDGELVGKRAEIFVIDKTHTNPYRAAERMGKLQDFTKEEILALREEGKLKAFKTVTLGSDGLVSLKMTPNCTYLIRTLI